ncbi:protein FAR1-RELATED SEQUENCE 2-like [Phaseolus vulgaris]|uniref:protein FAR1-RELATED SEQUENCE 2-like n=1 Tax=Phaseolus vulgaris TaxID=3885 RepID=UPI0035CC0D27
MIDKTLFIKKSNLEIILVQIYVDDIIFGATQDSLCEEFVAAMKDEFEMPMMGELSFFLGLQVKQTSDGIFLCQSKYCKEILKKFEMESCKESNTPSSCYMDADAAGKGVDQTKYRGLIGSLLYLTASRPDIMFVRDVRNYVSQHRRALGKDGDGRTLLAHFSCMRELNRDFFFEIDIDDENHIRNVFWADARSRAAYEHFGDVVLFDTTYLTNKYDMSFTVLITTAPIGIVTDQCRAMKNVVVVVVFPQTRHRWCLWDIMKKIAEKLAAYQDYKNINHQMKVVVYESMTVAEYTHRKFVELQNVFKAKMNCLIQDVSVDGYRCKYPVLEECMQNERTEDQIFIVFFHRENHDVQCNCMLFELRGILCKHCLVVVAQERLEKVLSKYVFMRWSKNLRRRHTYIKASYTAGKEEAHIERYDTMCKRFCHIAEVACVMTVFDVPCFFMYSCYVYADAVLKG